MMLLQLFVVILSCGFVKPQRNVPVNPVALLLNTGVQNVAKRPSNFFNDPITSPTLTSSLTPLASEESNPLTLMLRVGTLSITKSQIAQPATKFNQEVVDNDLDLLRPPQRRVHVLSGLAAAFSIVSGVIVATLGYKLLRISALICGFAIGAIVFYVLGMSLFPDPSSVVIAAWVSFLVGGIVVGVICLLVEQLGNFLVGASGGISLAILIHISFGYLCWKTNPNASFYIWGASLTLLFGLLCIFVGKPLLIVSTSFAGALMFVWGIGYFSGRFPCVIALPREQYVAGGEWHYDIPSAWWGYLTAILVVAIAGIGLQFAVTALEAVPNKPTKPHHDTHKLGHQELQTHHHHRSSYEDEIEMVETGFRRDHHRHDSGGSIDEIEKSHRRFDRDSSSIEDHYEHRTHHYGEDMEPVTETTYTQIGTPRHMHEHHHHRH